MQASERDLHAALRGVQDVWELDEPAATTAGLSLLARLVPCDFSAVTWNNTTTGTISTHSWPADSVPAEVNTEPEVVAAHPLVPHLHAGTGALRIGDVLSDRAWRNHPVRQAMAEVFGNTSAQLERMLGWARVGSDHYLGYAVNRIGSEFSQRDQLLMSIVAPPLSRHRQLLIDRAAARGLLENGHDAAADAVVLDPSGRVEQAWCDGERLYLAGNPGTEVTELPAPDLPTGYRLLTVRTPRNRPTARELLILDLGSRGLTSAAIARRLDTSPRTVHKHLENLYRKLGVSDRASAVRVAVAAGYLRSETSP